MVLYNVFVKYVAHLTESKVNSNTSARLDLEFKTFPCIITRSVATCLHTSTGKVGVKVKLQLFVKILYRAFF